MMLQQHNALIEIAAESADTNDFIELLDSYYSIMKLFLTKGTIEDSINFVAI